ncbi:hypothetical protein ABKN59_010560 [Abortiporus biennis]
MRGRFNTHYNPRSMSETGSDVHNDYGYDVFLYSIFACATILIYDSTITFGEEVNYVWSQKLNLASWIFIRNRNLNIIAALLALAANLVETDNKIMYVFLTKFINYSSSSTMYSSTNSCLAINDMWSTLAVVTQLIIFVFFTIRIWAIWHHHWLPLVVLAPLALLYTSLNIWFSAIGQLVWISPRPGGQCHWRWNASRSMLQRQVHFIHQSSIYLTQPPLSLNITLEISALGFAFGVIVGTLLKTMGILKAARMAGIKSPITYLVIRDGSLYALIVLLPTVATIVVDLLGAPGLNVIVNLGPTITSVCVSRFILDLRTNEATNVPSSHSNPTSTFMDNIRIQTMVFAGNASSTLSVDDDCVVGALPVSSPAIHLDPSMDV